VAKRIKRDDRTELLGKPYHPVDLIAAVRRLFAPASGAQDPDAETI
jgi:hypothetical protein